MPGNLKDAMNMTLSDWQINFQNDNCTVEVIMDGLTGSFRGSLRNQTLEEFIGENPDASGMKDALEHLMLRFESSKDPNDYFSGYGPILCRSQDWGIPAERTLEILQFFFSVITRTTSVPNRAIKTITAESQQPALNAEDRRIIEYIGGFILRSIYYYSGTTEGEKEVILMLKCDLQEGMIASERSRLSNKAKERLWGVQSTILDLLGEAEISFRQHAAVEPKLNIRPEFYTVFNFPKSCISKQNC